jgi:hypothetical protein
VIALANLLGRRLDPARKRPAGSAPVEKSRLLDLNEPPDRAPVPPWQRKVP